MLQKRTLATAFLIFILSFSGAALAHAATTGVGNTGSGSTGVGNTGSGSTGVGNTGSGSTGVSNTGTAGNDGTLQNPLNNIKSLPDLMNAILDAVVKLGVIVLTIMIVYVGFLFVAAQGREEQIKSARSALTWTIIGGLILLGAKAISLVIQSTVAGL